MGGYKCSVCMWLGLHSTFRLGEVSTCGRLKMQCLYVAGTTFYLPLRRGIHLWEVKNAVFVCGWDYILPSA